MAKIKPFKAIRPTEELAGQVAALPYDVYNRSEAKEEIQDKPYSFLRIDRAETTLDDSVGTYEPQVYDQAKRNLEDFMDKEYLVQDDKPNFYLYELTMNGREQTGIVACCDVDDYLNHTIKRHEQTRKDKEQDRINHVDVLDANTGPIYLTYKENPTAKEIIKQEKENPAAYDFTSDDNVRHRVWVIDDPQMIEELQHSFEEVDNLYIADGHHRCASAVSVALKRREENPDYNGDEEFNSFLSVIFPSEELKILDYNRVVRDLNGLSKEEFLDKVAEKFEIQEEDEPVKPEQKATFGMFLDNQWYKLTLKDKIPENIIPSLDVSILYDNLLGPVLGIQDPRTDKRIDFVGGIRGLKELEKRTNTDMEVAFSLYPTDITELIEIADQDLLMPPKSTWFEPKLRSGLFIHKLSE